MIIQNIYKKIKRSIHLALLLIPGQDYLFKKIEIIRGLYVYPRKMLGRKLFLNQNSTETDVLVFAAHSDDDVLGLGATLNRHQINGENIKIIYVTNGTADSSGIGKSWNFKRVKSLKRAEQRYLEGVTALSLLNIPSENVFCLGYPDGGTQRYLKEMSEDVAIILRSLKPKRVYVHCIEGGHIDHDLTSFVVKSTCNKIGYSNVYEWSEYNPLQPLGTMNVKFLSSSLHEVEEIIVNLTEEEQLLKRRMLSCHNSQNVESYFTQGEAIRKANLINVDKEVFDYCTIPKIRLISICKKFH